MIILVIGMDQSAEPCPQLGVCRVFSLLRAHFDPSPAIDSGGLDNGKHSWERLCLNCSCYEPVMGFYPKSAVCVCVSASGLVFWEGRLRQKGELQEQRRSSTLQRRWLPGGEVGGSRAFPQRSPLPLPWGRNQKYSKVIGSRMALISAKQWTELQVRSSSPPTTSSMPSFTLGRRCSIGARWWPTPISLDSSFQ